MLTVLVIGLGGFLGAVLRYTVSGWMQRWSQELNFPHGTLIVNLIGCLLIGLLSQLVETKNLFNPEMRMFLFIGLLGAFTTFSTFGAETLNMISSNRIFSALLNIGMHLVFGLGFVWFGRLLAGWLWK